MDGRSLLPPGAGVSDRGQLPLVDARRDLSDTGVVVIGRNEGERLQRSLASLRNMSQRTVYVDSGSSDGSVEVGRKAGVSVVELDQAKPFTAARARNSGFRRLLTEQATLVYVFFVDGDCEVAPGWI